MPEIEMYTISELTKIFDISARTIRFYEEKGLLSPHRTSGNQRRYTALDRRRLKWIMRGQRFGYSLNEVSKMLTMVDSKTDAAEQIKITLQYGEQKLNDIENHIQELRCMYEEMKELKDKLKIRLEELSAKN